MIDVRHATGLSFVGSFLLAILGLWADGAWAGERGGPRSSSQQLWDRVERVVVYKSPRRARYPSIIRTGAGEVLVLFTRQTEEQEIAGTGDLVLSRSGDGGKTWSEPETVYQGTSGDPRSIGTMTVLRSGRILAPFEEWEDGGARCTLRILSAVDGGKIWSVEEPKVESPFVWLAPSGRLVETSGDELVMGIHGAASEVDLKATIHGSGVLRSKDEGKSWGAFSWIARGRGPITGAPSERGFSFEGPALLAPADGRWLAMVSGRSLGGGLVPQALVRLWSEDEGRTWTKPEMFAPGAWPGLAVAGDRSTACAFPVWQAWGTPQIRLMFSDDGFESFFQELPVWQPGRVWRFTTPPQLVPYLPKGSVHFGVPSAVALGENLLAVAIDRTQQGSAYVLNWEPPDGNGAGPDDHERIDVILYERQPPSEEIAGKPVEERPAQAKGRWVLAKQFVAPSFTSAIAQQPDGNMICTTEDAEGKPKLIRSSDGGQTWSDIEGSKCPAETGGVLLGFLKSGRWLAASLTPAVETEHKRTVVGEHGGYPIVKQSLSTERSVLVHTSDDEGKTWQGPGKVLAPLHDAVPVGRFIESADGTVTMSVYGCLPGEDAESYSSSVAVFRSGDRGESWGDCSIAFRSLKGEEYYPQPEPRYTETDIQPLPDGRWAAFARTEYGVLAGKALIGTSVSYSSDAGRTWSTPRQTLMGTGQLSALLAPQGELIVAVRNSGFYDLGVYFSHDLGRTWSYALPGAPGTAGAGFVGKDGFVVFGGWKSGRFYRWERED